MNEAERCAKKKKQVVIYFRTEVVVGIPVVLSLYAIGKSLALSLMSTGAPSEPSTSRQFGLGQCDSDPPSPFSPGSRRKFFCARYGLYDEILVLLNASLRYTLPFTSGEAPVCSTLGSATSTVVCGSLLGLMGNERFLLAGLEVCHGVVALAWPVHEADDDLRTAQKDADEVDNGDEVVAFDYARTCPQGRGHQDHSAHVDRDGGGRLGAHDVLERGQGRREHGQTESAADVAERRADVRLGLTEDARHTEHYVERHDAPDREGDGVELAQSLALLLGAPAVVNDVVQDADDLSEELGAEEREPAICRKDKDAPEVAVHNHRDQRQLGHFADAFVAVHVVDVWHGAQTQEDVGDARGHVHQSHPEGHGGRGQKGTRRGPRAPSTAFGRGRAPRPISWAVPSRPHSKHDRYHVAVQKTGSGHLPTTSSPSGSHRKFRNRLGRRAQCVLYLRTARHRTPKVRSAAVRVPFRMAALLPGQNKDKTFFIRQTVALWPDSSWPNFASGASSPDTDALRAAIGEAGTLPSLINTS
ncbi:hypothetical protein ON010_g15712 [Phytophthora cinnamomi]|nr:hypothetical protein ON010_g15712 [Phytophthora cinnamomi]